MKTPEELRAAELLGMSEKLRSEVEFLKNRMARLTESFETLAAAVERTVEQVRRERGEK